jgi:hypothetical protein
MDRNEEMLDRKLAALMAEEYIVSPARINAVIAQAAKHRQRSSLSSAMGQILEGLLTPWPVGMVQKSAFLLLIAAVGFGIGFQQELSAQPQVSGMAVLMDGGDRGVL